VPAMLCHSPHPKLDRPTRAGSRSRPTNRLRHGATRRSNMEQRRYRAVA
jgi:hypothetical protein